MSKVKEPLKKLLIVAVTLTIMGLFLSLRYDLYYDLNDDTVIRDILSGIYAGKPSGFNIQFLYSFNIFVALCYRSFPSLPWYGLIMCGLEYLCVGIILYRVIELLKNVPKAKKIIIYMLAAIAIVGINLRWLVFMQYTVVSGMLMATTIFIYLTGKNKKTEVISIILVALAFQIRTEMCLMLFPILGIAGLARWNKEKEAFSKENLKYYLGTIIFAFIAMGLLLGADRAAYKFNGDANGWKEYRDFFDARTTLYDFYGIPEYSEDLGITKEQYTLLQNYNFAIDDSITADTLYTICDYQKGNLNHIVGSLYTRKSIKEAIWCYKRMITSQDNGILGNIIMIEYALLLFVFITEKYLKDLWKLILVFGARSSLFIYLFMVERSIDRVTYPLLLAEITILTAFLLGVELKNRKYLKSGAFLVLFIVTACIWIEQVNIVDNEYRERESITFVNKVLDDYCKSNPQNFYYLDVYSTTSYDNVVISEKIFKNVDNSYRNYDICGGWLAKSPLALEKKNSCSNNSKLNFVCYQDRDLSWIANFYEANGIKVDIQPVDMINYELNNIYSVYEVKFIE